MRITHLFRILISFVAILPIAHPAIAADAAPSADLGLWQSFFSEVVSECPLVNQDETMKAIRALEAAQRKDAPFGPKYRGAFDNLPEAAERIGREIEEQLVSWDARWELGAPAWDGPSPTIQAYAGIRTYGVLRIGNEETGPLALGVAMDGQPLRPRPITIPAGKVARLLVPIDFGEPGASSLTIHLNSGEVEGELSAPVNVDPGATIKGTIVDSDLGRPFPGRVYVKCSDGVFRHAKAYADEKTVSEKTMIFPNGVNYRLPFFYSDGSFEIDVPAGKTLVTLERGFEHAITSQTLELKPDETREMEIASGRIVTMKERGWISGDTHVHWAKNWWNEDESLDLLKVVQRAEDVQVVNNLTLRHNNPGPEFIAPTQRPMGPVVDYSDESYLVQMGEEYRNAPFYGHVNYLNIKELIQPISTGDIMGVNAVDYPTNYSRHLLVREQGGIVIQAHGFTPETPADIALEVNDSLDQTDPEDYYRVLDCGFRQPLTNGSDHPARLVGCARAYVKVEGELSYLGWIKGIQAKRTFATSGPLLFLDVNGADIGDEAKLRMGETMTIKARAVSRHPLGRVQIVSNGKVLKEIETGEREAELKVEMPADESRWVVARCSAGKSFNALNEPNVAHTSAVYAIVDGQKIFNPEAAREFAKRLRGGATNLENKGRFADDEQRREAVEVFARGAERFEAMTGE